MLVITPQTICGRIGAVISALIVVSCAIGLTMHRDFYAGIPRKDFFCFYTNVSNLCVGVYFALAAPRLYASKALYPLIPHAEFLLMMSIMLTFFVFHLMIFPAIRGVVRTAERTREYYIARTDNLFIHYLVPWLVFAYWLICSPGKASLRFADAFLWTLLPALYLVFVFLRAKSGRKIEEAGSLYPYPFLDLNALGCKKVLSICLTLYAICIASGTAIILAIRLAIALFGSGHPLILI